MERNDDTDFNQSWRSAGSLNGFEPCGITAWGGSYVFEGGRSAHRRERRRPLTVGKSVGGPGA